jgi:pimeloyl-ACP methyl ester carboxylesterase
MTLRIRDRVGPYGWVRFFETYLRTPRLRTERLRAPCLVVSGERDFVRFPADAQALAAALPDSRLHVLADCGHFPMVEQPAELATLVAAFLAEASLRPLPDTDSAGATATRVDPFQSLARNVADVERRLR